MDVNTPTKAIESNDFTTFAIWFMLVIICIMATYIYRQYMSSEKDKSSRIDGTFEKLFKFIERLTKSSEAQQKSLDVLVTKFDHFHDEIKEDMKEVKENYKELHDKVLKLESKTNT